MPSCIIRACLPPALFHKQITLNNSEYFKTWLVCFIKATIMFHMKEDIPYIKKQVFSNSCSCILLSFQLD